MKLVIGSDHAGFALKEELKKILAEWHDYQVEDVGTFSGESVDYPDYAAAVARRVADGTGVLGVLVCGTGIGVAIAANKVRGVRAATCTDPYCAEMARAHNDANVLCLGARVVGGGLAAKTLRAFLETRFEGGRHQGRVDKISALER
jgi:ribose 5-phosphate isomerase B